MKTRKVNGYDCYDVEVGQQLLCLRNSEYHNLKIGQMETVTFKNSTHYEVSGCRYSHKRWLLVCDQPFSENGNAFWKPVFKPVQPDEKYKDLFL